MDCGAESGDYFGGICWGVMLLHLSMFMRWQLAVNLSMRAAARLGFLRNLGHSSKPRFEVMIVECFLCLSMRKMSPA